MKKIFESRVGNRSIPLLAIVAFVGAMCVAPFVLGGYHIFQLTMVACYAIAILGLNLLTGFNGQVSLGHGAFYAIGAYTCAIVLQNELLPYWLAVPVAGVLCLVVGFLFGLPALRLGGFYLALTTFSLALALPQLLKFNKLRGITGGVQGIVIDKPSAPAGIPLDADQWLFFCVLITATLLFIVAWNLVRGRVGAALIAIRDHPTAAAAMGMNTAWYKTATFGVSAMLTGIAGALAALATQFVSPDSFHLGLSISLLVGVVVGGLATIWGAVFGAVFVVAVPTIADQLSKSAPSLIYGIVLIVMMYLMPTGFVGLWNRVTQSLGWRRRHQPSPILATELRSTPTTKVD